jgi:hypothetical protein
LNNSSETPASTWRFSQHHRYPGGYWKANATGWRRARDTSPRTIRKTCSPN